MITKERIKSYSKKKHMFTTQQMAIIWIAY